MNKEVPITGTSVYSPGKIIVSSKVNTLKTTKRIPMAVKKLLFLISFFIPNAATSAPINNSQARV